MMDRDIRRMSMERKMSKETKKNVPYKVNVKNEVSEVTNNKNVLCGKTKSIHLFPLYPMSVSNMVLMPIVP